MATAAGQIGLTEVLELPPNSELFDGGKGGVPGFGVRRQRSDAVALSSYSSQPRGAAAA